MCCCRQWWPLGNILCGTSSLILHLGRGRGMHFVWAQHQAKLTSKSSMIACAPLHVKVRVAQLVVLEKKMKEVSSTRCRSRIALGYNDSTVQKRYCFIFKDRSGEHCILVILTSRANRHQIPLRPRPSWWLWSGWPHSSCMLNISCFFGSFNENFRSNLRARMGFTRSCNSACTFTFACRKIYPNFEYLLVLKKWWSKVTQYHKKRWLTDDKPECPASWGSCGRMRLSDGEWIRGG